MSFRSDIVAAEVEKIQRFNCILQHSDDGTKSDSHTSDLFCCCEILHITHGYVGNIFVMLFNTLCSVLLENSHLQRGQKACVEQKCPSAEEGTHEPLSESSIAEALQRTSKAIQEIDALVSATTLTWRSEGKVAETPACEFHWEDVKQFNRL